MCASVSNKLGKVWEEGSLVAFVKKVKDTLERDEMEREYEKMCLTRRSISKI